MITARLRNNLVLIQKKVITTGSWNSIVAWVQHAQAWVSIEPQRGREGFSQGERESTVTHKIRGDYNELIGVDETMRIVWAQNMSYVYGGSPPAWTISDDARVFDILAVMPDFEKRGDVMISALEKGMRYAAVAAVPA